MKRLLIVFGIFASLIANRSTVDEQRANEMAAILTSSEVQSLLHQEDGVGSIEGISFVPSMTECSNYAIQFSSYSAPQAQTCIMPVNISNTIIALGKASCKAKAAMPSSGTNVCAHPSPIGCLDNQDSNQPL